MFTVPNSLRLTETEAAQWRLNGYFVRPAQFAAKELAALQLAAAAAASGADRGAAACGHTYTLDGKRFVDVDCATVQYEHAPGSTTVRVLEPAHLFHPELEQLVDDPRLWVPMADLLQQDSIALWTTKLNMKSAAGSGFGWHQDAPYWMHDCSHVDRLPNVMVALDPQSTGSGCFRVIRGSHRRGILPGTEDGTQLGGFYTDPACFDLADQVAMEVAAGSLIFFDAHTVHGSEPNLSDQPRRALIYTYQPAGFPMLKNGEVRNVPSLRARGLQRSNPQAPAI